jgi:hypothetical protein
MSDDANLPATTPQSEAEGDHNALVPRRSTADVVEVERAVPDLASAVASLQDVLDGMRPDDLHLEIEADRVRTKFRLHAYRHRPNGRG